MSHHAKTPIQAEKEDLGPCCYRIVARVPAARVREETDHAVRRAAAGLKVPGFRPGKVPTKLARELLGPSVEAEVREHLFQHVIDDALRAVGLHARAMKIHALDPDAYDLDAGEDLELTFEVETSPEVELPEWKEIVVEKGDVTPTEEQVRRALAALAEQHERFEEVEGGEVEEGFPAEGDLTFVRDGVEGPKAEGLRLDLDTPIYGAEPEAYEAALRRKRAGEEARIPVTFLEGFEIEDWVGHSGEAVFAIRRVVQPRPATEEEIAEDLRLDGPEALRKAVVEQLTRQNEAEDRDRMAREIVERILALKPFELAERMVDEEARATTEDRIQRLVQAGRPEEEVRKEAEEHAAELRQACEQRLKHWFVLRKVAQQEKVRVSESELKRAVAQLAMRQGLPPDDLWEWFQEDDRLEELRSDIVMDKTRRVLVDRVLEAQEPAVLEEGPTA